MNPIIRQNRRSTGGWRLLRSQRAFTLFEIIAALVLLSLLAAIFGMGLVAAMQSHEFSRANVNLVQKAQPAMARMARELTELIDIEAVSTTGQDPFILYRRMPDDDTLDALSYGLHFNPGDKTILLYTGFTGSLPLGPSTVDQGDILVDGVSNLAFHFYEGDGPWRDNYSDLQLLSAIEIVLDLYRPKDRNHVKQFHTVVHLRNTSNFGGAAPTNRPAAGDVYGCFIGILRQGGPTP